MAQRARKGLGNVHVQQLLEVGAHSGEEKECQSSQGLLESPAPHRLPSLQASTHSTLGVSQGQDNYSISVPSSIDAGEIVYAVIMT